MPKPEIHMQFVRNIAEDETDLRSRGAFSEWSDGTRSVYGSELFEGGHNIFSVDAERTRLVTRDLGGHWAVGAIVMQPNSQIVSDFGGMIDPYGLELADIVREQIVPIIDLPQYDSPEDLYNDFWLFWMDNGGSDRSVIALADMGAPVEASLFASAQVLDLDNREFCGPYPLHELGTRLFDAGIDPDIDRIEFAEQGNFYSKHDPLDDAIVSAHCFLRAGQILYNQRHFQTLF